MLRGRAEGRSCQLESRACGASAVLGTSARGCVVRATGSSAGAHAVPIVDREAHTLLLLGCRPVQPPASARWGYSGGC